MSYCPVCNGFQQVEVTCPSCQQRMDDQGRCMDYFDDYSAYLPIELTKEVDGIPNNTTEKQCPHLVLCTSCNTDKVLLVREQQ